MIYAMLIHRSWTRLRQHSSPRLTNPPRRRAKQIEGQHRQRAGDTHERGGPWRADRRRQCADDQAADDEAGRDHRGVEQVGLDRLAEQQAERHGREERDRHVAHETAGTVAVAEMHHRVAQALLEQLNEPLLSATLILAGDNAPLTEAHDIRDRLEHQADLIIDGGYLSPEPTTIIDLSGEVPVLVRMGKGNVDSFGLEAAKA